MRGEVDVWHMVIPHGVMKNKLMVSVAPVVSNAFVAIND
jgi:hypothetical protein